MGETVRAISRGTNTGRHEHWTENRAEVGTVLDSAAQLLPDRDRRAGAEDKRARALTAEQECKAAEQVRIAAAR